MVRGERHVADEDLARWAGTLARRFIQRLDLYPMQVADGRYLCIHEPLNPQLLAAHLKGDITLGTYLFSREGNARFVVLDADDDHGFERLRHLAERLATEDIPGYLERSRRGGHLWLFLAQPVPAKDARYFGLSILKRHAFSSVEVYPKQDHPGAGPGSLIRLPFGIHRLSGRRYGFYDMAGHPIAPFIHRQIERLGRPRFVPQSSFEAYLSTIPVIRDPLVFPVADEHTESLAEAVKARVSVMGFIGNYVELRPTSSGAIGLCPFHDDQRPSLGVNAEHNYWHCFAGCGGGSIIDFWMKWRGLDFEDALDELRRKLL
jgi:hypothetical protein